MSDDEVEIKPYEADRAKRVAKCKKCKKEIVKNELRIARGRLSEADQ